MARRKEARLRAEDSWIHRQLFEQVPFSAVIIDHDFNVIDANENFAKHFGSWKGKKCYEVYKKLTEPCVTCPSRLTFEDGLSRVTDSVGVDQYGRQSHYVVHTAPLRQRKNSPVEFIIEMSTDVTETQNWQQEYQILFDRVPCYITVIDSDYRIIRANEAFRHTFGEVHGRHCYEVYKKSKRRCPKCPAARSFKDGQVHHSEQIGVRKSGERTYYNVATSPLRRGGDEVAHVIEISNDITDQKKLEEEVLEAERLAAVGQTVAGLAHSVKNILMGLEGGKYIVSLGLKKDDREVISQGWEMLERNFEKTTSLVKDFLSFARGRKPELQMVNANELVTEIVDLYRDIAAQNGVILKSELSDKVKKLPLDPKGIHTCLTNLVSNAIDACEMSEKKDCAVIISTKYEKAVLSFEVVDTGCGMDTDIKRKIFTTFFTTKGGGGTGLGLLTTRKIVQEHGGKIIVTTRRGEGSRFRMDFPRKRLMLVMSEQSNDEDEKAQ